MRYFGDGFESGDTTMWNSAVAANDQWTLSVVVGALRKGAYGMRCLRTGSAGSGAVYVEQLLNATGNFRQWAGPSEGGNVSVTSPFYYRFYVKPVTYPSTGPVMAIMRVLNSTDSYTAIQTAGTTTLRFTLQGGASVLTICNFTVGNWYRFEGKIEVDTAALRWIHTVSCYDASTTTLLGTASDVISVSVPPTAIRLGAITAVNRNNVQDWHFDDFAVNDSLNVASGWPNTGYCGPGAVVQSGFPTADGTAELTPTGDAVNHYANVDDWVTDTDYNTPPTGGANSKTDTYAIADYAGANTVVAAYVQSRSRGAVSPYANHYAGLKETVGGNFLDLSDSFVDTTLRYIGIIIGEMYANDVWTNAKYNSAQLSYRRLDENTSARDLTAIRVHCEDNDAGTVPTSVTRRRRGHVV